jgi:hypothetical protein
MPLNKLGDLAGAKAPIRYQSIGDGREEFRLYVSGFGESVNSMSLPFGTSGGSPTSNRVRPLPPNRAATSVDKRGPRPTRSLDPASCMFPHDSILNARSILVTRSTGTPGP